MAAHGPSSLSDDQQVVMSILMMGSAFLSIIGSSTIIYRVARNRQKTTPYDRIMFGLSCSDLIASIGFLLSPILVPAKTSPRVWAMGDNLSCSVLGWITQLGFAAIWYNNCLAWYYLATLRFNISIADFEASYEAYIHLPTVFFFLFTATSGFLFDFYTELPVGMGCWITEYCISENNCIGITLSWAYAAIAIIFTFISLPASHLLIFLHFRQLLQRQGATAPTTESRHIRRAAVQGFLYVASFFIAFTPASILRLLEQYFDYDSSRESEIFWLLLLHSMSIPSQGMFVYVWDSTTALCTTSNRQRNNSYHVSFSGFFNVFIYSRPRYLRLKDNGVPFWKALWIASFEHDIPSFIERFRKSQDEDLRAHASEVMSQKMKSLQGFHMHRVQEPVTGKSKNDSSESDWIELPQTMSSSVAHC